MKQQDFYTTLEQSIADRLQLSGLYRGRHTIRNEKSWRENEIEIDFIWLVVFDLSFSGKGGIFYVKYLPSEFRNHQNPEKLLKAIFSCDETGRIQHFYQEEVLDNFQNINQYFKDLDLFAANKGITLDGISYRIRLWAANITTTIEVNNPNQASWKKWENELVKIGNELAKHSKNPTLLHLFPNP